MNHLLGETFGIDNKIQDMQTELYKYLTDLWETNKLDGYGRVYRNTKGDGIIPEVYDSKKGGYVETYYNNQSCFFFIDDETQQGNGFSFETSLTLVFMLNLEDICDKVNERIDEKVFHDVMIHLRETYESTFTIQEHRKGINNVLSGFNIDKIQTNDLQPLHVFSVKGLLEYFVNDNSC